MESGMIREYLGDSVYVETEPGSHEVKVYLSNGVTTDSEIYIEPHNFKALVEFVKQHGAPEFLNRNNLCGGGSAGIGLLGRFPEE
jgi:hypothetical protein